MLECSFPYFTDWISSYKYLTSLFTIRNCQHAISCNYGFYVSIYKLSLWYFIGNWLQGKSWPYDTFHLLPLYSYALYVKKKSLYQKHVYWTPYVSRAFSSQKSCSYIQGSTFWHKLGNTFSAPTSAGSCSVVS